MIFKKQISVFIAMLVLVSSSGLAFNIHFCEGKIASITSVFSKGEVCIMPVAVKKSCCAKVETTHSECCSDKQVNFKDNAEKELIKISVANQFLILVQENSNYFYYPKVTLNSSEKLVYYCDANAPPFYTLCCQYTFYA
jgi:hypothetical protein